MTLREKKTFYIKKKPAFQQNCNSPVNNQIVERMLDIYMHFFPNTYFYQTNKNEAKLKKNVLGNLCRI